MDKKYIATEITALTDKEYMKFRVFDQMKIDYFSLVKGFLLDPPIATYQDENSKSIHVFFVNEYEVAEIFKKVCENFITELNLENDVKIYKSQTGHSEIESKILSEYFKKVNFAGKMSVFEPSNYFNTETIIDDKQRFSFLLGQYIRFYEDDKFILIDSWKSYVLLDILKSFCISRDELKSETYFGIPGATHFSLNSDSELLEYLEIWKKKIISGNL